MTRRLQKNLIGVIALFLFLTLNGCFSQWAFIIEPPYTEDGLIDVTAYNIPELEVEQDVLNELDEYIEALREAQKRLSNKVIQLTNDGRIPPMPHGVLTRIDKAVVVACFPGGWTFM